MKKEVSKVRKLYIAKLIGRCIILAVCLLIWLFKKEEFTILDGMNFFDRFSVFHILWAIWLVDMLGQLIPVKNHISLGSQKHFLERFRPIKEKINKEALKNYIVFTTKGAYRVMLLWVALIGVIAALYHKQILDESILFLIAVVFYVCDLICVLVWCPFRLIMRNRCCTTCRIFNWDHLMMFSPIVFVGGFYCLSLFAIAFVVWCVWELCVMIHPERFWEQTNVALRCSECTDKLCTQYCQKLRR